MDNFWNSKVIQPPPVNSFKCKSPALDINSVTSILDNAISTLIIPNELRVESVLMRRIIYKLKLQFRLDKGFKLFENTNRNLNNLFSFDITKDLMYLLDEVPKRYEKNFRLPSKQMLEYVLVRLQAYSQVCSRVVESSFKTVDLMRARLRLGHQWEIGAVILAMCCRIWQFCRYLTTKSCMIYNDLLPLLDKLQIAGSKFLPDDYIFPKDLLIWLNYDWLVEVPDVIYQLPLELPIFNLLDDDDNETQNFSKNSKRKSIESTIIIDENESFNKFYSATRKRKISKSVINLDSDSDVEIIDKKQKSNENDIVVIDSNNESIITINSLDNTVIDDKEENNNNSLEFINDLEEPINFSETDSDQEKKSEKNKVKKNELDNDVGEPISRENNNIQYENEFAKKKTKRKKKGKEIDDSLQSLNMNELFNDSLNKSKIKSPSSKILAKKESKIKGKKKEENNNNSLEFDNDLREQTNILENNSDQGKASEENTSKGIENNDIGEPISRENNNNNIQSENEFGKKKTKKKKRAKEIEDNELDNDVGELINTENNQSENEFAKKKTKRMKRAKEIEDYELENDVGELISNENNHNIQSENEFVKKKTKRKKRVNEIDESLQSLNMNEFFNDDTLNKSKTEAEKRETKIKVKKKEQLLEFLEKENNFRENNLAHKCVLSNLTDDDWDCVHFQIKYLIAKSIDKPEFEKICLRQSQNILNELVDISLDSSNFISSEESETQKLFLMSTEGKKYLINSIDSLKSLILFYEKEKNVMKKSSKKCIFSHLSLSSWDDLSYKLKNYIITASSKPLQSNICIKNSKKLLLKYLRHKNSEKDIENLINISKNKIDKLYKNIRPTSQNWDKLFDYFHDLEIYKDPPKLSKKEPQESTNKIVESFKQDMKQEKPSKSVKKLKKKQELLYNGNKKQENLIKSVKKHINEEEEPRKKRLRYF